MEHLRGMHSLCVCVCVPCSIPLWSDSSMPMRGPQGPLVSWALMRHSPRSSTTCMQTSQKTHAFHHIFVMYVVTKQLEMMAVKFGTCDRWHLWLLCASRVPVIHRFCLHERRPYLSFNSSSKKYKFCQLKRAKTYIIANENDVYGTVNVLCTHSW